ncbi:beta strand repeat-containing protein [Caenimonas koreensis]|uniref:beta strand repeat-containing protein n=1 Tax=Caenimonas koreensis TaxID=367474 RepID=UPI003782F1EA
MKLDNDRIDDLEKQVASMGPLAGIAHTDGSANPNVSLGGPTGPDTGANAVRFALADGGVSDPDSSTLSLLEIATFTGVAPGDVIAYRDEASSSGSYFYIPWAPGSGYISTPTGLFIWTVVDWGYGLGMTFRPPSGQAPIENFSRLLRSLSFNNTSDQVTGSSQREFKIRVADETGAFAVQRNVKVDVNGQDDLPTFTSLSGPFAGTEDVATIITIGQLTTAGNEADLDGTVNAFVVKTVAPGTTLEILSLFTNTFAPWAAGTNDVIDGRHPVAKWTSPANANGLFDAFTVVAKSNDGGVSVTPVQASVMVAAVNDAPVLWLGYPGPLVAHTFVEMAGPDTGANAVHLVDSSYPISDVDSTMLSKLQIETYKDPNFVRFAGDTICYGDVASDFHNDPSSIIPFDREGTGVLTTEQGAFKWTVTISSASSGSNQGFTLVFESLGPDGQPAPAAFSGDVWPSPYLDLLSNLYYNNTLDAPSTLLRAFIFTAFDESGTPSEPVVSYVNMTATNEAPTLTAFNGAGASIYEDSRGDITFASLLAASNAVDPDGGPITAFVVTSVNGDPFSLWIAEYGQLPTEWTPGYNDVIDAYHTASWQGPADATGIVNVFSVVAVDSTGMRSATPIQVPINLLPVNDAPTLSTFSAPVTIGHENLPNPVAVASLLQAGNEADKDGTVAAFVVRAVTSGTLLIGTSLSTATAWAPGTNDVVDATHLAFWTPPKDTNGTLDAFTVVALDNGGATSAPPAVQVQVTIAPPPMMTSMAGPVAAAAEDSQVQINFRNVMAESDTVIAGWYAAAVIVKEVVSGTLLIRNSQGVVAPWVAGTNDVIDAFHAGYWTPDVNSNGVLDAVKVIVRDEFGSVSRTPVLAQVDVASVNDRPTFTTISSPVASIQEDQSTLVTVSGLQALSNAADVDGTVTSFVVTSVASGTLLIGQVGANGAFVGTPWAANTNDTIDATHIAQWTPAANANGQLNAFKVVAQDDGGARSGFPVTVQAQVASVNDAPTLTAFSGVVDSTLPATMAQITMAELSAKGDEQDVDGNVVSFMVTSVTSGTLRIGPTLATAEVWGVGSNDIVDGSHIAFWTPAANASGTVGAFAVVALDDTGLQSTTPVAVNIAVLATPTSVAGTVGADTLLGGAGDDTLRGLGGNDLLAGAGGNDVLDGGAGTDKLVGGDGSDVYLFLATDHTAAEINDTGVSGTDEVRFVTTTTSTLRLYAGDLGVERIVIGTGLGAVANTSGLVAAGINATALPNAVFILGNAGANALVGTGFDDTIDGGAGADVMTGGNGNDTFYVDSLFDKVVDSATAGGIDTVYASVTFTLSTNVEKLFLTGSALNGTGNASANTITGNANANLLSGLDGNDTLDGGDGNDTLAGGKGIDILTGGAGADVFLFDTSFNAVTNVDRVADFTPGTDVLSFKATIYKALGALGPLNADAFWSGPGVVSGHDTTDRIVYDTTSGTLYYDSDGSGAAMPVAVAIIGDTTHPVLSAADFVVG